MALKKYKINNSIFYAKSLSDAISKYHAKDNLASDIIREIKSAYPEVQIKMSSLPAYGGKNSTTLNFKNFPGEHYWETKSKEDLEKRSRWLNFLLHIYEKHSHQQPNAGTGTGTVRSEYMVFMYPSQKDSVYDSAINNIVNAVKAKYPQVKIHVESFEDKIPGPYFAKHITRFEFSNFPGDNKARNYNNAEAQEWSKFIVGLFNKYGENWKGNHYNTFATYDSAKDSVHDDELADLSEEEKQAIEDYKLAIQNTNNPRLLNLYSHILQEEIEHLKELQEFKSVDDSVNDIPLGYEPKVEQKTIISWKNIHTPQSLNEELNRYNKAKSNEKEILLKRLFSHLNEVYEDYEHDKANEKISNYDLLKHYKKYNTVIGSINSSLNKSYKLF